ncbi:MAG: YbjN domain-containing protein [Candidatus Kapabacteria bacterium]|jgi:hypothetical protein|nr:YbjN domain-containing protein [Candidatus Kapabacteria bacterium]
MLHIYHSPTGSNAKDFSAAQEEMIANGSVTGESKGLIDQTIKRVEEVLDEHFPDYLKYDNGSFAISRGSTHVSIVVRHFLKGETIIESTANVVSGAEISQKLMNFLLRKNAQLHFGSFSLLFDDTITYSHSISGSNLDSNELITSLSTVAFIADYYDDIIVENYGGKRSADIVSEFEAY